MNELDYLLHCLNRIDSHYLNVMGINKHDEIYQQAAENAFTAELYHKLKSEQHRYNNKLVWHFDLTKERANSIRPDLVLHESPKHRNDQRIFIEVKTSSNTSTDKIISDLDKLNNAVKENNDGVQLGFKIAFYIVAQIDLNKIKLNLDRVEERLREKIQILNYNEGKIAFEKLELNEI